MTLFRTVQEEVLERLGRVGVTARHAVESLLVGSHRSIRHGLSVEFVGHREYQPGDDLRHLDWMVWARTDRHDVRVFEEETRLRATLVVDCSGSMAYGSGGRTKLDYARMLAAVLGVLMVRQHDAVGLALVDNAIREHHPPAGTMGHLMALLARLEATPAGGETSLAGVLHELAGRMSRRGLTVLISDTFDDVDALMLALAHLRHRRQDVRVFQVVDPEEETFPFRGAHEFAGMETEPRMRLDADRARPLYQRALAEHRSRLAAGCHALGVALEICRTSDDLAMVLVRALAGPWLPGSPGLNSVSLPPVRK
jgi:uncharacterized protein (DUF58 family)